MNLNAKSDDSFIQSLGFYARTVPKQVSGVEIHELGDEIFLYAPELEIGVSLNSSAKTIWDLCDGQRPIMEIIQFLAESLEVSPDLLSQDVVVSMTRLSQLGLVELSSSH